MSVSETGFTLQRRPEIYSTSATEIQGLFGNGTDSIDLSVDSIMGVLYSLVTRSQSQVWELSQGVYDSIGIYSAEGVMLDNIALLSGQVRLPASYTSGFTWVTATSGTIIPKEGVFTSVAGDTFNAVQEQIITTTACRAARIYINTLLDSTEYSVGVGSNSYFFTTSATATYPEVLIGLQGALAAEGQLEIEYVLDSEEESKSYLKLNWIGLTNISLTATTYVTFDYVTTPVSIQASVVGAIPAESGTVNSFTGTLESVPASSQRAKIYSVGNPDNLTLGSKLESDLDLRRRAISAFSRIAGGTSDSIHAGISAIKEVTDVKVIENLEITPALDGQPPKSLKIVVYGGVDQDIADSIWMNKPAGIHTWVDRSNLVRGRILDVSDYTGQVHTVQFTRPETQFVWVKVEYTRYSEEPLGINAEATIKATVEAQGDLLSIGQDIVPNRFIGNIYKAVSGLEDVIVSMAINTDPINSPPAGNFTEDRITITDEQITNFSTVRVTVIDNTV